MHFANGAIDGECILLAFGQKVGASLDRCRGLRGCRRSGALCDQGQRQHSDQSGGGMHSGNLGGGGCISQMVPLMANVYCLPLGRRLAHRSIVAADSAVAGAAELCATRDSVSTVTKVAAVCIAVTSVAGDAFRKWCH